MPTAGLVTGHTDAGNCTVLRKSAVVMTIPIVARVTIQTFSTKGIQNLIAVSCADVPEIAEYKPNESFCNTETSSGQEQTPFFAGLRTLVRYPFDKCVG